MRLINDVHASFDSVCALADSSDVTLGTDCKPMMDYAEAFLVGFAPAHAVIDLATLEMQNTAARGFPYNSSFGTRGRKFKPCPFKFMYEMGSRYL
jgi:hypothetical protein